MSLSSNPSCTSSALVAELYQNLGNQEQGDLKYVFSNKAKHIHKSDLRPDTLLQACFLEPAGPTQVTVLANHLKIQLSLQETDASCRLRAVNV